MSNIHRAAEMIEDSAARWAIRLDDGALDAPEEAALDAWLAEDSRHQGALLRAQATLAYLDRGRALAAGGPRPNQAMSTDVVDGPNRRRFLQLAAGGGAALAAGLGTIFVLPYVGGEEIRTDIGEVRRVPLADGSVAVLNTATRLDVALQPKQRAVRLQEGEAWFQVAHDKARPFVVEAGTVRIRAVGTAFAVRRRGEGVDVLVTEGVVETWIEGREASRRRFSVGTKAFVAAASGPTASILEHVPQEVERTLAWRNGEIALNGETVDYAVAELNRYNRRRIVIADAAIGRERVVGYFRTTDPANFAGAVADMTGAHMVERADEILVVR